MDQNQPIRLFHDARHVFRSRDDCFHRHGRAHDAFRYAVDRIHD